MARASQIYIVHWKGKPSEVLAAFTVKYESQQWVSDHDLLPQTERYRIKDGGGLGGLPSARIPCPWEEE